MESQKSGKFVSSHTPTTELAAGSAADKPEAVLRFSRKGPWEINEVGHRHRNLKWGLVSLPSLRSGQTSPNYRVRNAVQRSFKTVLVTEPFEPMRS